MNEQRVTELDPAKVYVDGFGRQWAYVNALWRTEAMSTGIYDGQLLCLFPDLREHVPAWYEPLLEKGWVQVAERNMVANISNEGEYVYMNATHIEGQYVATRFLPNANEIAKYGTFAEVSEYADAITRKVTP